MPNSYKGSSVKERHHIHFLPSDVQEFDLLQPIPVEVYEDEDGSFQAGAVDFRVGMVGYSVSDAIEALTYCIVDTYESLEMSEDVLAPALVRDLDAMRGYLRFVIAS